MGRFTLLLALIGVSSCQARQPLDLNQVQWLTYTNSVLKYSLSYPNAYTVEPEVDDTNVMFKTSMYNVPLVVRYTTEAEGRQRGLWFGNPPTAPIELSGKKGYKYVYSHYDGPFGERTIAYVIEYKDRFLGLEFRADGEDLDGIQKQILESFKFKP